MKTFNDWDWRIKILGPIFYSLVISGLFAYDFLSSMTLGKMIALALIIIGYSFMLVARFQLKDRFSIEPRAEKGIITNGIYSILRHPIYLSSSVSALGVCLYLSIWFNNILLNVGLLLFAIAYIGTQLYRAKKEEAKMVERYGKEYIEYKKKTVF